MSIAIAIEKPGLARLIAPVAQRLFPDQPIVFPVFWPFGLYAPALPRGLKWQQYPCILPFDTDCFSLRKPGEPGSPGPIVVRYADGQLQRDKGIDAFNDCLRQARQIIALPDPGPGLYHYQVARQRALGQSAPAGEIRALYALDETSIERALLGGSLQAERVNRWTEHGRTKHYFDYQFAANSLAILGKTAGHGQWVSKYQLQALYMFSRGEVASESQWLQRMHRWEGTGRYANSNKLSLGSLTSMATILTQLEHHGWVRAIEPDERPRRLGLSNSGRQILARLHPNCEDPDLPFRIQAWCEQGLSASRLAIDRYIRTFFGRQKRFLDALSGSRPAADARPTA